MTSRKQMREDLYNIIAEVLCIEPSEITPNSRFIADINGESIDLLDLSFRCEKHYGVKIDFQKAVPPDKVPADAHGMVTAEGLAFLQSRFPFLDLSEFAKTPHVSRILELITVEVIAQVLFETIEAHERALPDLQVKTQAASQP